MKVLRIGVMGCASIAHNKMIPSIKSLDSFKLVAVASRTHKKANEFANKFQCESIIGYQSLLDRQDIDVIYMPLPTGLHSEWLRKAIDAGKHVLVEKSFATSFKEAKIIVDLALSKKIVLKENYMFEYHSQQKIVRDHISNAAGQVRLFRANFGFPPLDATNFRYDSSLGGGALLDAGGYVLKSLTVFFPSAEFKVKASSLEFNNNAVDISGSATLDIILDDRVIPANLAFGFDHFYQCNIEIWGSNAKLTTNRTFTAGSDFSPEIIISTVDGVSRVEMERDDHFRNILVQFYSSIMRGSADEEGKAILSQAKLQQELYDAATN